MASHEIAAPIERKGPIEAIFAIEVHPHRDVARDEVVLVWRFTQRYFAEFEPILVVPGMVLFDGYTVFAVKLRYHIKRRCHVAACGAIRNPGWICTSRHETPTLL